ncbi:MAG TPA: pyridoxamine 5'-phosphate oxidase family protein [Chitinophagaceae bacterium]|jgi:nitroimidazol reductase NimA-like FMN-containing flavoprotein (pyridoxamine 5'-phosphate oxidase superfamily)|nr:pyridoxamine 5'-phosphate oxidase family protein [Chitinophagaceae bacterium]
MFGELNTEEIEELLTHQLVGRLGCCLDNRMYVLPISYAYDGHNIYARSQEGEKTEMMRKNPNVCFQVDSMHNMANWQSVVCWGKYEELRDEDGRGAGLKKLINRVLPAVTSETVQLSPDWPFAPDNINDIQGIVFRIIVSEKTGRFEKKDPGSFFAS